MRIQKISDDLVRIVTPRGVITVQESADESLVIRSEEDSRLLLYDDNVFGLIFNNVVYAND